MGEMSDFSMLEISIRHDTLALICYLYQSTSQVMSAGVQLFAFKISGKVRNRLRLCNFETWLKKEQVSLWPGILSVFYRRWGSVETLQCTLVTLRKYFDDVTNGDIMNVVI